MQSLLQLAFPPQCVNCGVLVAESFGLCGRCWRDTHFIAGVVCDACGAPLPGEASVARADICDDCMKVARPWSHGRSALIYRDNARRLILAIKHGDRLDLVRPAAHWLAGVAAPCLTADSVIVPVPAHYFRLLRRRYNQAAALAMALSKEIDHPCLPDLLTRIKRTRPHEGMTPEARFANMDSAIRPSKSARKRLAGRSVVLVDDVMTSGATLAAATVAALEAGARDVCTLVLARAIKED